MSAREPPAGVAVRIETCCLRVGAKPWTFAEAEADAIVRHWQRRSAQNSKLFNGVIHMCLGLTITDGVLAGEFAATDFASFLYWRDTGCRDESARDVFGSALVRSREGHLLLGLQRPGQLNSGLACPPSGMIDPRDVTADGMIDIDGSIARELGEETGLSVDELTRQPGYLLVRCGPLVSIGRLYDAELSTEALARRIRGHIAADNDPELDDVILVGSRAALRQQPMHEHVQVLLRALYQA